MIETIISDSELLEYALLLLFLSPFVFAILYLMVYYPNKLTYKKKGDKKHNEA